MLSKKPQGSSVVLKSRFSAVEAVYKRIVSVLKSYNYSSEDIFAVHLGLEEAFINAVKHGSKGRSNKEVIVNYSINPNEAEIFVTDEGDGFNPEAIPDPRLGDNVFKLGGRGLFLIKAFMDKVEFNETGNCIRMVKYKGNPEQDSLAGGDEKKISRFKHGKAD